jgi:hypothetical protein
LVNEILPPIIEMWQDEDDRDVVNSLCEDFQVLIEKCGPAVIVPDHVDNVCHIVLQILERKAPCQLDTDEEEETAATDKPEEQSEYDALLICSACDLVATLAKALGADFGQAFGQFYPEMAKFYVSDDILAVHICSFVIPRANIDLLISEPRSHIYRACHSCWITCRSDRGYG